MLQVNKRADLDNLFSSRLQQAKAKEAAPVIPLASADATAAPKPADHTPTSIALGVVAENIEKVFKALEQQTQQAAKPVSKKMEAIVHRDGNGKMARIEINVI